MIVCTACGTRNEDGESFCGECGSYLEWEGERVGPPPEPEPAVQPVPEAEPGGPGFVQRVKTAVGLAPEHDTGIVPVQEAPPAGSTASPAASTASPVASTAPPAASPAPPASPQPDPSALVVPLTPAAPEDHAPPSLDAGATAPKARHAAQPVLPSSSPAAVRPGAAVPKPRRRELPPEERRPAPGETICGSCGAGNAPARKFCRRCGNDLADAPVARRAPWWRRLFTRSAPAAPIAGARPKARIRRPHHGRWITLGVVVVLVAAAFLTRPLWSSGANQVLDRVKGTKIVNPTSFHASSSAGGHGAGNVRDGAPNVYWAPDRGATAIGQNVRAGFATPFRLVYLRVFNGASDQLEPFLTQSSVQRIDVTITRKGAGQLVKHFTLTDKPGGQELHVAVSDVTAVRVTIRSVYRPAPRKLVALGELEFLARK